MIQYLAPAAAVSPGIIVSVCVCSSSLAGVHLHPGIDLFFLICAHAECRRANETMTKSRPQGLFGVDDTVRTEAVSRGVICCDPMVGRLTACDWHQLRRARAAVSV